MFLLSLFIWKSKYTKSCYVTLARFLMVNALPVKPGLPSKQGEHFADTIKSSQEQDFVWNSKPPDPKDATGLRKWIGAMLAIRNDKKQAWLFDSAVERLVPVAEPWRYEDSRIDEVLTEFVNECFATITAATKPAPNGKTDQIEPGSDASYAARASAEQKPFREFLRWLKRNPRAKQSKKSFSYDTNFRRIKAQFSGAWP